MNRRARDLGDQLLWLLGGFLGALGVVSLPSIGMFLLAGAIVVLIVAGAVSRGRGWPLLLIGAAAPMFWVAWLHRGGPGMRCWETQTASGCEELLNPWPFALAGLLPFGFAVGLLITGRVRRNKNA